MVSLACFQEYCPVIRVINGEFYLLHLSQTALATFAITPSRVASSAGESETKTAIAKCRPPAAPLLAPLDNVTSPMSLVAAVTPLTVPDVPVLCATIVPAGR